jgi:nucleoid-associated protein YgaU
LAETAPVRAKLAYKNKGEAGARSDVEFTFNPSEYTLTSSTSWKQTAAKGKNAPKSEFTGTLPQTLSMDVLLVSNWLDRVTDVYFEVGNLIWMTRPTEGSLAKGKPQSPVLRFEWGILSPAFDVHLKSVTVKHQEFDETGKPTRATASIVLEEVSDPPKKQNPTSGGPAGNRAHVVSDGDSLASIAFREYDDPALWRGLADLNGIDDPMRLRLGQRLIVPPIADVAARS